MLDPTPQPEGLAKLDALVADLHALAETWRTADPDKAAALLGGGALSPTGSYAWVRSRLPQRQLDAARVLEGVYEDVRAFAAAKNGALRRSRKPAEPVVLPADFRTGVHLTQLLALGWPHTIVVGFADELAPDHPLLAEVPEAWRFVEAGGRRLFVLDGRPDVVDGRVVVRDFFALDEVAHLTRGWRQAQVDDESRRRQAEEDARQAEEAKRRAWEESPAGREAAREREVAALRAQVDLLQREVTSLRAVSDR